MATQLIHHINSFLSSRSVATLTTEQAKDIISTVGEGKKVEAIKMLRTLTKIAATDFIQPPIYADQNIVWNFITELDTVAIISSNVLGLKEAKDLVEFMETNSHFF